MRSPFSKEGIWAGALAFALSLSSTFSAQSLAKPELLTLKFEQKLSSRIPPDLAFTDDRGKTVQLRDYLDARPIVLMLGYYQCPMLCSLQLNGAVECFQELRLAAGTDFDVVFVSIDPGETAPLASAKKATYLKRYSRAGVESGWHFLVGNESNISALAAAIGFQYGYDARLDQYAHPSGMVVLTPEGKVSKYLFGVSYSGAELNEALKKAKRGEAGSRVRELLLLCFQHMPLMGKNSEAIMGAVRGLAVLTLTTVGAYVFLSILRERLSNVEKK